jgi:Do/DeqQ family serine protease
MSRRLTHKRLIGIIAGICVAAFCAGTAPSLAEGGLGKSLGGIVQQLLGNAPADQPAGTTGQGGTEGKGPTQDQAAPDQAIRRVPLGQQEMELSFAPLVKRTEPAVVNVYAAKQVRTQSPFAGDPFFEQFFGGAFGGRPRIQKSLGSGVIVDPSGLVVTNYHVIAGADEVKVATADGREFQCKILLRDKSIDLAVLKLDTNERFPTLALGNSDGLEVGDLVLAIGNPFGVGQTVTSGIVSALARTRIGASDLDFFIQTDAAINPGNSGGALIDMQGRLVGINSAIYSQSGGSVGIGFAIPSNMVRAVIETVHRGGTHFERPYVGATFQPVTQQVAESLGLSRAHGALVNSVASGSPAEKGGLKVGDVVLAVDGVTVDDADALNYRLATAGIGHSTKLDLFRGGKQMSVTVALERAPEAIAPDEHVLGGNSPFTGAKVANLSPRNASDFGLATDTKGVVVAEVQDNSPAQQLGLQPGDIVRAVNGQEIKTTADLDKAAGSNPPYWRFAVERNGQIIQQIIR